MISGHNPWNQATPLDQCYQQYRNDITFLQQHLPISDAANQLLQQIFRREFVRNITLAQIRERIQGADSFFMDPEAVGRGGWNLKSAARSYFGGSPKENAYLAITGPREEQSGRHETEEGVYLYEMSRSPTSHSGMSPSSTVDSTGPNTPEMRAQPMSDIEVAPSEGFAQESMYAASPNRSEPVVSPKRREPGMSSFLRRFVDRFVSDAA